MADVKITVDYSELTGLVKTSGQTKQALSLMAKEFAKTGDVAKFKNGVNALARSQANLKSSSQKTYFELLTLGKQMKQQALFADELGSAYERSAAASQVFGKRANRTGVLAQQAGYQFGDFAVQVQSGTNVMVAFGQQATQLIGTMSMLATSTKAILAFSALGVLVPVGTAIAGAFMRASDAADDSAKSIENAFSDLPDFFENLGVSISDSFDLAFTEIESKYGVLIENLGRIQLEDTKNALVKAFEDNVSSIEDPSIFEGFAAAIGRGMLFQTGDSSIVSRGEQEVAALYESANAIREIQNAYSETVKSAENMQQILELTKSTEQELAQISQEAADAFTRQAEELGVAKEIVEDIKRSDEDRLKLQELLLDLNSAVVEAENEAAEAKEKALRITYQQEQLLQNELDLLRAEADFGKDSVEYKSEQNRIALEIYRTELQRLGLGPAIVSSLVDQKNEALGLKAALEGAANASSRLAKFMLMNPVNGQMADEDAAMSGQVLQTSSSRQLNRDAAQRIIDALNKSGRSGRSGGSRRTEVDYLKRLEEEAAFKQTLVGLSEEETLSLERRRQITELLTRNNRTLTQTDQERISAIIATEEKTRALIAEEERRNEAINLVKENMENAFMDMVQGSKTVEEAFRAMLLNIISEIYRQTVVKTFVGAFTGFFGFKDGGAFSNGTQVKAFANGGVVDGPTTFPMSGGRTGLMGEAGPEAIMPLKRGSDGKLGVHVQSGSSKENPVIINQSFNFQANGDESVKKLITQAAPKIADMAKNSVLDARRRGGQMKSTFR